MSVETKPKGGLRGYFNYYILGTDSKTLKTYYFRNASKQEVEKRETQFSNPAVYNYIGKNVAREKD